MCNCSITDTAGNIVHRSGCRDDFIVFGPRPQPFVPVAAPLTVGNPDAPPLDTGAIHRAPGGGPAEAVLRLLLAHADLGGPQSCWRCTDRGTCEVVIEAAERALGGQVPAPLEAEVAVLRERAETAERECARMHGVFDRSQQAQAGERAEAEVARLTAELTAARAELDCGNSTDDATRCAFDPGKYNAGTCAACTDRSRVRTLAAEREARLSLDCGLTAAERAADPGRCRTGPARGGVACALCRVAMYECHDLPAHRRARAESEARLARIATLTANAHAPGECSTPLRIRGGSGYLRDLFWCPSCLDGLRGQILDAARDDSAAAHGVVPRSP